MTRRLGLHAALFSLAPLVQAQAPADPSVEWIRAHAIPFSTSEAGHGFDDLAGLENVIGDARIVALGEQTHGTREAFQMKHRLLEYLVERHGFSIFSIEANMPEAYALDAYVNGGEGDSRQLIAGMYFWTWNTEEVLAMVEWMRAWNVAHPERPRLRFTGFDMQTPTVAARVAAQFLRKHAPHMEESAVLLEDLPARDPWIQRKPEPVAGLVEDAEEVLADMLAHRDEFARMTSAREADWAIQNARVVAQWARMTCAEYVSRLKSGVRDECMAENVAWILEQDPGTRAVLWAHNGHVSRAEFQGVTPMGGHLGRRFPDQMVVFGFSTGRGTYTAFAPRGSDLRSDNALKTPPEDSIESYLASARLPRFLLDIRVARDAPSASWAIVPHPMRQIGAKASMDHEFFPCVVRDAFDVLVWQAETTASVPIRR